MKFEWEVAFRETHRSTYRAKVIGGWVLRHTEMFGGSTNGEALAMVFIPDAKHEWNLEDEPDIKHILISDLPLLNRTKNVLCAENIHTVKELLSRSEHSLLITPNFGKKSLMDVQECLKKLGLPRMVKHN